jgi:hypothetical protein
MMQYNLNVQRELVQGTILSVGYVGSHGVNLISGNQQNPAPYTIDSSGVYHFTPSTTGSFRENPALGTFSLGVNGTSSTYNSLQVALNRRLTHNLQGQVSYTWSHCQTVGDATLGSLDANAPTTFENPHDWKADASVCGYNIQQALRVNTLYQLPFHGNRAVEGWQLTGIVTANTGLPFNVSDGSDQSNALGGTARPNYVPNAPAAVINGISYPACNNSPILGGTGMYFNPNCFAQEAFGTLGNFGRLGLYGPGLVNVDMGVLKTTKIRENVTLQFRGELFNIFNHTNLAYPIAALFTGTPGPTTTLARTSTAGQITSYAAPSREIQLGLKLVF